MAVSAVGGAFETIEASSGSGAVRVAGDRLIDVGDHRLNIRCAGSGSPTVILEPGLGEPTSEMAKLIAPQVARTTRVCVYDRAGHGRSDAAPDADAARDLHELLRRARVPGPFVLAGHSLGGMLVLSYADRYPAEVAGVALIDSMHPKQTHTAADMEPAARGGPHDRADRHRPAAARPEGRPPGRSGAPVRARRGADAGGTRPCRAPQDARRPPARRRDRRRRLAAGLGARTRTTWRALSSRSFHRTVAGSTHGSLILDPDDARASSRAIADVVLQVRSER